MLSFSPQKIEVNVNCKAEAKLILQQNFYPHWYYINEKEKKEVQPFGVNFMSAPINKGENKISFVFEPTKVKVAMMISLIVFIIMLLLLVFLPRKEAK